MELDVAFKGKQADKFFPDLLALHPVSNELHVLRLSRCVQDMGSVQRAT